MTRQAHSPEVVSQIRGWKHGLRFFEQPSSIGRAISSANVGQDQAPNVSFARHAGGAGSRCVAADRGQLALGLSESGLVYQQIYPVR